MLKPGDRGELVTSVTTTLNRLGFLSEVSDNFDTQVSEAIRAFQQARGLSVSGLIDSPTEKALEEAVGSWVIDHFRSNSHICAVMMLQAFNLG